MTPPRYTRSAPEARIFVRSGFWSGCLQSMPSFGDDREADLLGRGLEDVGDALAVELLVVEDVDLLGAETLGPLGADRALDVVGGDRRGSS